MAALLLRDGINNYIYLYRERDRNDQLGQQGQSSARSEAGHPSLRPLISFHTAAAVITYTVRTSGGAKCFKRCFSRSHDPITTPAPHLISSHRAFILRRGRMHGWAERIDCDGAATAELCGLVERRSQSADRGFSLRGAAL